MWRKLVHQNVWLLASFFAYGPNMTSIYAFIRVMNMKCDYYENNQLMTIERPSSASSYRYTYHAYMPDWMVKSYQIMKRFQFRHFETPNTNGPNVSFTFWFFAIDTNWSFSLNNNAKCRWMSKWEIVALIKKLLVNKWPMYIQNLHVLSFVSFIKKGPTHSQAMRIWRELARSVRAGLLQRCRRIGLCVQRKVPNNG